MDVVGGGNVAFVDLVLYFQTVEIRTELARWQERIRTPTQVSVSSSISLFCCSTSSHVFSSLLRVIIGVEIAQGFKREREKSAKTAALGGYSQKAFRG